jgi:MFS family permease
MTPGSQRIDDTHRNKPPSWSWLGELSRVTRLTVRREFVATLPLAAVYAVTGMGFCGFVGRKALAMPDKLLAVLMASNFLGLLLAGPLIGFFHRVRKVTALSRILFLISILLITVVFIPQFGKWAPYLFLVQIFLAQTGVALTLPLRATIWRVNYPALHRGKIMVITSLCVTLGVSAMIFLYTAAMDHLGLEYPYIYGISGIIGLAAAYLFSRVKIHHERSTLLQAREQGEHIPLLAGLSVLRTDKRFRLYMAWQMLNGFSTLMIETVLVVILADTFKSNWLEGGAALTAVPFLANGVAVLFWARFYDRYDIFTIRFYAAMGWALSRVVLILGVWQGSIAIVLLSRLVSGAAMGGGQMAWRLGHMAFAPKDKDTLYMGAHISLTGLRGMLAPVVGLFLYNVMGANGGLWLIAISFTAQVIAAFGFRSLRTKFANEANHV